MAESITYNFHFTDGHLVSFELPLSTRSGTLLLKPADQAYPPWTVLDVCKCSHCPYTAEERLYCPVAANLAVVMDDFKEYSSYERVQVDVITSERIYLKELALQDSLYSFMGLIMGLV